MEICWGQGIGDASFYNCKTKYGGMELRDVECTKDLDDENSRLNWIVANLTLEIDAVELFTRDEAQSYSHQVAMSP